MLSRRFFLKVASGLLAFVPAAKALASPPQPNQVYLPFVSSDSSVEALDVPPPPSADWNPDAMILNSVVGTIQKVTSDQILVDAGA